MNDVQKDFPVSIGVRVTSKMDKQFREFAKVQGATISELLRGAIRKMLDGKNLDATRKDL
jgi:hypothetical protein